MKTDKTILKQSSSMNSLIKRRFYRDSSSKKKIDSVPDVGDWDDQKEAGFHRAISSHKFGEIKEAKAPHFFDIGMKDQWREIKKSSKMMNLRQFLLNKYMDRQWITDDELRYLTYSSKLGNRFLDRKLYQNIVNSISVDVKSEVEMMIAEEILSDYYEIKNVLMKARREYLKEKYAKSRNENLDYIARAEEENQRILRQVDFHKWLSMNVPVARDLVSQMEEHKKQKDNYFVGKFMHKGQNHIHLDLATRLRTEKRNKEAEEFYKRNTNGYINTFALGRIKKNEVFHLHHPSSKVFVLPEYKKNERVFSESHEVRQKVKEMERMKVHIKGQIKENRKDRYQVFYSGGPNSSHPSKRMTKQKAAILIQKIVRGYQIRKRIQLYHHIGDRNRDRNHKRHDIDKEKAVKKIRLQMQATDVSNLEKQCFINPNNQELNKMKEMSKMNQSQKLDIYDILKMSRNQIATQIEGRKQREELRISRSKRRATEQDEAAAAAGIIYKKKKKRVQKKRVGSNALHIKQTTLLSLCHDNKFKRLESCGYQFTEKDVNVEDIHGNSPLFYTCRNGSVELTYFLLERKADPNYPCQGGNTAMHMAFRPKRNMGSDALFKQCTIISQLIWAGGSLNILNDKNQTPLAFGPKELVKMLNLEMGVAFLEGDEIPTVDNDNLYKNGNLQKPEEPGMVSLGYRRLSSTTSTEASSNGMIRSYMPKGVMDLYERKKQLEFERITRMSDNNSPTFEELI